MCFFNQTLFGCGCFKWGNFSSHCPNEKRRGEACRKPQLVGHTNEVAERCKLCEKIEIKNRKIAKEHSNIARWAKDGNRNASIAKAMGDIRIIEKERWALEEERLNKLRTVCSSESEEAELKEDADFC